MLLVVDEAHRATGGYAYVEVVKFIRRFNESFRVLALTATPGSKVEQVQEVIDGLDIARVEIRTEQSLDIRQYVHKRKSETMVFDNTEEMEMLMVLFSKALQPVLSKLNSQNAYWAKDPMMLTPFGLTQARVKWMQSQAGQLAPMSVKGMVHGIFTVLASLAHSINLLKYHGIGPFFHSLVCFRNSVHEGGNGSKYRKQINDDESFNKIMTRVKTWLSQPNFIGHPKLDYLQELVLKHFVDASEGLRTDHAPPSATRVMVFAHFRDSAEEIVRVLKRHDPMIRPHVFVGQANSKGSAGMDQKQQLDIIQKFKSGVYNVLVATSIGEEGLDIGEIDLILCYDSNASPIRMLQRMGRTGRKRAGKVVLLLMRGKEEKDSVQANDNYEKMQEMIASGSRFTFHDDRSKRIVPRDVQPVVDKRVVEIPLENTQHSNLPEPRQRGRAPKRPPKKFHMPDNVRTGFVQASRLNDSARDSDDMSTNLPSARPLKLVEVEPVPPLDEVILTKSQELALARRFQYVHGQEAQTVSGPRLNAFHRRLRTLGPIKYVPHSASVEALRRLHTVDESQISRWRDTELGNASDSSEDLISDTKADNPASPKRTEPNDHTFSTPVRNHINSKRLSSPHPPKHSFRAPSSAASAPPSSPPPTAINMRIPSQGISLGSSTPPASNPASDSEVDSEIADFVVDDAAPIVPLTSSGVLPSSSLPFSGSRVEQPPEGRFYVSQGMSRKEIESDEDDELPEVEVLSRATDATPDVKRRRVSRYGVSEKVDTQRRKKRNRRVIDDSSSE